MWFSADVEVGRCAVLSAQAYLLAGRLDPFVAAVAPQIVRVPCFFGLFLLELAFHNFAARRTCIASAECSEHSFTTIAWFVLPFLHIVAIENARPQRWHAVAGSCAQI